MKGIAVILSVLVAAAVLLLAYVICLIPEKRGAKAIIRLVTGNGRVKVEILIFRLAGILLPFIRIGQMKREKMTKELAANGISMTPEMYTAMGCVRVGLPAAGGIILMLLSSLWKPCGVAAAVCFLFAVTIYLDGTKALEKGMAARRNEIEYELPRFVNTVATELKYNRDMVRIIEKYMTTSEGSFYRELQITVADMKSGNQELALKRLEGRVSSAMLSQVIRGLTGVIRGDDGIFYFNMLSHDFRVLEQERLRGIAAKQPDKMKKYMFAVFACFIAVVFVALAVSMLDRMKAMF